MGGGTWTKDAFVTYSCSLGRSVSDFDGSITTAYNNQDMFAARRLDSCLNPYKVVRECRDSEEHPNTLPVILALDVTGSMGQSAVEVAKQLNVIMTKLYSEVKDVEFLIMGIGDLAYDESPIQASQFESDIRIAEQLDKVYFEFGGGGNSYESYTAAWYFGAKRTNLDCWNRGKRGIIITMGDEELNPYLPYRALNQALGDSDEQSDVETKKLYEEVSKKFNVYHIHVNHRHYGDSDALANTWTEVIGKDNYKVSTLNDIADTITDIIVNNGNNTDFTETNVNENGEIVW